MASGGRFCGQPAVTKASVADVWRVPLAVWRARRALDAGELEAARTLVAPVLGRFGTVTLVRKIAAEILYASGDPLSAASLFEQAARRLPTDPAFARSSGRRRPARRSSAPATARSSAISAAWRSARRVSSRTRAPRSLWR